MRTLVGDTPSPPSTRYHSQLNPRSPNPRSPNPRFPNPRRAVCVLRNGAEVEPFVADIVTMHMSRPPR